MKPSSSYNLANIGSAAGLHSGHLVSAGPAQNQDPTKTTSLGRVGSFLGPISSPAAAARPVTADLLIGRISPTDASRGAGFLLDQQHQGDQDSR